jgi:hypothetical protein
MSYLAKQKQIFGYFRFLKLHISGFEKYDNRSHDWIKKIYKKY